MQIANRRSFCAGLRRGRRSSKIRQTARSRPLESRVGRSFRLDRGTQYAAHFFWGAGDSSVSRLIVLRRGGNSVRAWQIPGDALRNPRVHARIVEGINIPRSLIVRLVEQAQRIGRLSNDLSADAVARCFVALFQGFVLQVVWGEDVDVESRVAALDRMLQGLANSNPQPTRRR